MNTPPPLEIRAVLDTSFWVAAYRAEVAANCLDLFDMLVPRVVEVEIRAVQPEHPQREYPHATLFRQLRGQMRDPPDISPRPLAILGAGEAEAIALASEMGIPVLINERRAAQYALNAGIVVINVPLVVVTLRALEVISDRAARRKLDLIESITPSAMVADARGALDSMGE